MLAVIEQFLSTQDLDRIEKIVSDAIFVDGQLSSGSMATRAKNNQEVPVHADIVNDLNQIIMNKLVRHPLYRAICWPRRLAAPIYARYQPGMEYRAHVDDPVMGGENLYRSDISMTIFLSSADSYDGGELSINQTFGQQEIKLEAGSVVFYPSSSVHSVKPVTRGTRYVAVSWIESSIRDPGQRQILYDLYLAREALIAEQADSEICTRVANSLNNLVRLWVEL